MHTHQHLRELVLGRPRVSTAVAWFTAMWRGDHLPCRVSEHRDFRASRTAEPERFTALVTGQLLARVPEAAALVGQITRSQAAALRGGTRVHFFLDASRLPADTDCTAVAYLLLLQTGEATEDEAHRAFDQIAGAVTPHGVITT